MNLELTLPDETRVLSFSDEIDGIRESLMRHETDYFFDREGTFNEYLCYSDLGIELLFENKCLASMFLYISEDGGKFKPFKKACSHLGEAFWNAPTLERFENYMTNAGFVPMETRARSTTKYIKDDVYCVYSKRSGKTRISFGLQSKL